MYITVYVPGEDVFTEPVIIILFVRFPSKLSLAVAPVSVYVSPTFRVIEDCPFNVITGGVLSVGVVVPVVEVVVPVLLPPPVEVVVPVLPPPPDVELLTVIVPVIVKLSYESVAVTL